MKDPICLMTGHFKNVLQDSMPAGQKWNTYWWYVCNLYLMLELSKIRPLSNNDLSLTFGFLKCDLKSKTWIILKYHTFVEIRGKKCYLGKPHCCVLFASKATIKVFWNILPRFSHVRYNYLFRKLKYLELIFVSSIVWSRSFLTLVVSCWNLWYYSKKSCRFSRWLIIIIQTELKVFHTGPRFNMLETQWQMLFSSNRFQIVGTIVKKKST